MKGGLTLILLAIARSLCAQVDTGHPCESTVYDSYLGPVRQTFGHFSGNNASIDEVRAQLRVARRFRYYFNPAQPYTPQLPAVTEARREGDCKAKSLWLASKIGDRYTRYVIGRATLESTMSHAWLLWSSAGTWYDLDPTKESDLLNADRIVGQKLIPHFSYTSSSKYEHPSYQEYVH